MNRKFGLLLALLLGITSASSAQNRKQNRDPLVWTELQVDYFLPNESFFFFRNQYRAKTNSQIAGFKEDGALSHLYQVYLLGGYDHKFTDHWRGSISGRYSFDANNDFQVYLATLQHNGKIGSVDFIKRLAYDVMKFEEGDSRGRTRLRAALERNVTIGKQLLRPHLSYEVFLYNNFVKEEIEPDTRTVDRSRLRVGISYKVSQYVWLTPYFTRQTDFFKTLATYDELGNEVTAPGNLNLIDPIIGFDLRFIIPGRNISESTVPNLGPSGK